MAKEDTNVEITATPSSTTQIDTDTTKPETREPLPALANIYKELFEMDAVEEVSLSTACCYSD